MNFSGLLISSGRRLNEWLSTVKVLLCLVGSGTISSIGRDNLDIATYVDTKKKHEIDGLLGQFPEVRHFADILPVPFRAVGSTAISPTEWLDLHRLIHETADSNPDLAGIAITHGT